MLNVLMFMYNYVEINMDEQMRELEFLIGDLEHENRLLRARNERLEKELDEANAEIDRLESQRK